MSDILKSDKKIYLIIGLGLSGYWAAKFLNSIGRRVIILESKSNPQLIINKKELESAGIEVFLNFPFEFKEISRWINDIECVVLSPIINIDNETVIKLKNLGIRVLGEINIGWNNLQGINWVGVTGTNGKTTVTHLLSHILCQNNLKAPSAGNIGTPLCKYAYHYKKSKQIDWLITELSSFQIEIAKEFKPKIGIWTTFTPDHLDRHKTLINYFNIKNQLLKNSEIRIYNYDDSYLQSKYTSLAEGIWVTSNAKSKNTKYCDYWINDEGFIIEKGNKLFDSKISKLKGKHNIQNLLLATAAARKIGLTSNNIKNSLRNFEQLPHRIETVYKTQNIEIVNDSKATNFDSSIAGMNSLDCGQIVIAGGIIKDGDHNLWTKTISLKSNCVFLYGKSARALEEILKNNGFRKDIFVYKKLEELIPQALRYLENSSAKILLFSPSCSSFDQFKNYEDRGNFFKQCINKFLTK